MVRLVGGGAAGGVSDALLAERSSTPTVDAGHKPAPLRGRTGSVDDLDTAKLRRSASQGTLVDSRRSSADEWGRGLGSRGPLFRAVPCFSTLPTVQLQHVARLAQSKAVDAGTLIHSEGMPLNQMFLVERGSVVLYSSTGASKSTLALSASPIPAGVTEGRYGLPVAALRRGSSFSASGLLSQTSLVADVTLVAHEDTRLVVVSRDQFESVLSDVSALLGDAPHKFSDHSDNSLLALTRHMAHFKAMVLQAGDIELVDMLAAFAPEYNAEDTIEQLVCSAQKIAECETAVLYEVVQPKGTLKVCVCVFVFVVVFWCPLPLSPLSCSCLTPHPALSSRSSWAPATFRSGWSCHLLPSTPASRRRVSRKPSPTALRTHPRGRACKP